MYQLLFKRIFDVLVSLILIIIISPLFLFIIISIIITERTFNVFYVSTRAANQINERHVRIIKIYKFRTMKINSKYVEPFEKIKEDSRITKIGKILRCCSLDELPQLFNVLKGDMSIVGNRPLLLREAGKVIFEYKGTNRFKAPAGITGLWQINKHKAITLEDRIKMDEEYASDISFRKDLYILLLTPIHMFRNF